MGLLFDAMPSIIFTIMFYKVKVDFIIENKLFY